MKRIIIEWNDMPLQAYVLQLAENNMLVFGSFSDGWLIPPVYWGRIHDAVMQKVLENMPEE